MLLALKELQAEGMDFNLTYSRGPFFLMGSQENIDADRRRRGLPLDAPMSMIWPRKDNEPSPMDQLMSDAGLSPRNTDVTDNNIMRDTMPAHRLAQYAAKYESNEAGERMWFALSRRWFMGKDTKINPVRLDGHDLLRECAEVAGLDMQNVERVLAGEMISVEEIADQVRRVHDIGINWIPQIVFEVGGLVQGKWSEDPSLPETPYRIIHSGSGSKASFKAVLQQLHQNVTDGLDSTPQPGKWFNRFQGGRNEPYTGAPADYAAAFEGGVRHYNSWPAEAKELVKSAIAAQGEIQGLQTVVRALVDDSYGTFGTKKFSRADKEDIVEHLTHADDFMALLRQTVL